MTTKDKDPVLVVLQLSGGNDYMNTVVPFANPQYYDNRPLLGVPEDDVLKLDDEVGLNPAMAPLKEMHDKGEMAIVHGVGWENSNRSHFRCLDIWHTAEPDTFSSEGWLGKATRELDPKEDNPVTTVNIGPGLPRALVAEGVSVASVADIDAYGLFTSFEKEQQRQQMLERFARIYSPSGGSGAVMNYLGHTGMDALNGADMVKTAAQNYSSDREYASNPISNRLRDVAKIHLADLGARILYTEYGGFDTHAAQATAHVKLLTEISNAIAEFWDDLRAHQAHENVIMLVFSEFGRRVKENGGGTDHGAAGVSWVLGPQVEGGAYGEYPDIKKERLKDGDLAPTFDFRGLYTNLLEDWLRVDPAAAVRGRYEKPNLIGVG